MIRTAESYAEWYEARDNQANMTDAQRDMAIGSPVMVFFLPPRRKQLPNQTRLKIFRRDGPYCAYCGCELTGETFTVDHIDAVANGGTDEDDNLTVACKPCNSSKGARDV